MKVKSLVMGFVFSCTVVLPNHVSASEAYDFYQVMLDKNEFTLEYIGDIAVIVKDGKAGLIDTLGNEILPIKYDWISYGIEGLVQVTLDDKDGLFDDKGNVIVPPKYDFIEYVSDAFLQSGLMRVGLDGKHGFIDRYGKEVIAPSKYDHLTNFVNDISIAEIDGKKGVINKNNEVIIPIIYDTIFFTDSERALVKSDGKWGYIDNHGKVIIPIIYDYMFGFEDGELAPVRLNGEEFYINKQGQRVD